MTALFASCRYSLLQNRGYSEYRIGYRKLSKKNKGLILQLSKLQLGLLIHLAQLMPFAV